MTLTVSPQLELPDAAVTETFAILAKRGAGKSNAAVVMAEQMHDAGLPWVAVDPKGDWWGVRSSRTGKSAGLPVLVLGGEHGDVPLEATAGALVADLLVEQHISAVVDVSLFSKREMRQFLTAFADRLYRANRAPLHVFAEEAHEYIPQKVMGDDARMVHAWERLVKWGRTHGLGVTLITQRSASLNKDVLTQVETLIAMRTTGPTDQAAVKAWVDQHDVGRDVVASLRKLDNGEAFVIGPRLLGQDEPRRVRFARRRTFDSGATPEPGAAPVTPRTVADVDLAAFKEAMAETIEKAKADDPKALRARIAELERQIAQQPEPIIQRVEVSTLTDDDRSALTRLGGELTGLAITLSDVDARLTAALGKTQTPTLGRSDADPGRRTQPAVRTGATRPTPEADVPHRAPRAPVEGGSLPKVQRAVLTVLAQYGERSKRQVAVLTGYSHRGGGFNNGLSALRTAGYIDGSDQLTITETGRDAVGPVEALPTGQALAEHWAGQLPLAARLILDLLVQAWPESLTKQEIADATKYAANGGGFNNALSKLRGLELAHGKVDIKADDAFGVGR